MDNFFKFFIAEYKCFRYASTHYGKNRKITLRAKFFIYLKFFVALIKPIKPLEEETIIFNDLSSTYSKYEPLVKYKKSIFLSSRSNLEGIFSLFNSPFILYYLINYPEIWFFDKSIRKFL